VEELAKGNLDVIDELVASDFVDRSLIPGQGPTREDFKRLKRGFLDAFTITSFTIEGYHVPQLQADSAGRCRFRGPRSSSVCRNITNLRRSL
jgi:hypothetical protein